MATNSEVIFDALREIGVIAEGQSLGPEQGLFGLRKLNDLMESWINDDIEVGWFEQDAASDEFPLPANQKRAVIANLAVELAPAYGVSVSRELAMKADDSMRAMLSKMLNERLEPSNMDHMPMGAGNLNARSDIENDE